MFVLLLQVLQYKKRCGDLEQMLQDKSSDPEKHRLGVSVACSALRKPAFICVIRNFHYIFSPLESQ